MGKAGRAAVGRVAAPLAALGAHASAAHVTAGVACGRAIGLGVGGAAEEDTRHGRVRTRMCLYVQMCVCVCVQMCVCVCTREPEAVFQPVHR